MKLPAILICACQHANVFPAGAVKTLTKSLDDAGVAYEIIPDLCQRVGRRDPELKDILAGSPAIAACHPRAVKWLFEATHISLPANAKLFDLRSQTITEITSALGLPEPASRNLIDSTVVPISTQGTDAAATADWTGWFPVIDHDHCSQCMQCLGFCLFSVFGTDEAYQVQVQHPDQCKPNCPACARVCPQGAIMFPKHTDDTINGGTLRDGTTATQPAKVDISLLLGGDAHALLRDRAARAKMRFSKTRTDLESLAERRRNLMLEGLEDIPPEILRGLPPPDVVEQKAREAAARAQAALDARKKT